MRAGWLREQLTCHGRMQKTTASLGGRLCPLRRKCERAAQRRHRLPQRPEPVL